MAKIRGDNDGRADPSNEEVEPTTAARHRMRLSPGGAFAVVSLLLLMGSILVFQAAKPSDTEDRSLSQTSSFRPTAVPRTSPPVTAHNGTAGNAVEATCAVTPDAAMADPGDFQFVTRLGGVTRNYSVHVPAAYDATTPSPVIMSLHDRGVTSSEQRSLTGLASHSDRFIIITPEALGSDAAWTTGVAASVDNVGFLDLALAQVSARLCTDADQTYLLGIGDGAHMASRFACESKAPITAVVLHVRLARQLSCTTQPTTDLTIISPARMTGLERVATSTATDRGCGAASSSAISESLRLVQWAQCTDDLRLFIVDDDSAIWPGSTADQEANPPAGRDASVSKPGAATNPEAGDRIDATLLALASFTR